MVGSTNPAIVIEDQADTATVTREAIAIPITAMSVVLAPAAIAALAPIVTNAAPVLAPAAIVIAAVIAALAP